MPKPISIMKPIESWVLGGNCIELLQTVVGQKFDFIFADPPFNIGQPYNGYTDDLPQGEYEEFTRNWIKECWNALHPNGVIALHGPDDLVEHYLQIARLIDMPRIAWVNWHYRFGQCGTSNWIDSRCHCLIFAKGPKWTWNYEAVMVDSDRKSQYDDQRIEDSPYSGKRLPLTVWGIPSDGPYWGRVQGNSKERRGEHPNQLPEVYLERLIRAYTNEGDWVLDPFGGSGTTITVANTLKRNCVTMDISKTNCDSIKERLKKGAIRVKA